MAEGHTYSIHALQLASMSRQESLPLWYAASRGVAAGSEAVQRVRSSRMFSVWPATLKNMDSSQ